MKHVPTSRQIDTRVERAGAELDRADASREAQKRASATCRHLVAADRPADGKKLIEVDGQGGAALETHSAENRAFVRSMHDG